MPTFDRWKPSWDGKTWAFRLFKGHHTQLNDLYWAHAPALRYVFAGTRTTSPTVHATTLLSLPNSPSRINISLGEWGRNYGQFDNWVRLNCVVAATAYLEVYLKTAIRLALESDPGLQNGFSRGIDGVALLKRDPTYSYAHLAVPCVRGDWVARSAHYKKIFGSVPQAIEQNIPKLEKLRRLRNGVAHVFGRDSDDYSSLRDIRPVPFRKVTEDYLKKSLGLLDSIAVQVDQHLAPLHIGDYEPIYYYHHWDKKFDPNRETEEKALRRVLGTHLMSGLNLGYFRGIVRYYRSV